MQVGTVYGCPLTVKTEAWTAAHRHAQTVAAKTRRAAFVGLAYGQLTVNCTYFDGRPVARVFPSGDLELQAHVTL
jgi:hypothetical protein